MYLAATREEQLANICAEAVPDSFFEPTLQDVQAHHASVVARSKRLNEAPLLTAKHRDADVAARDAKKAEKWPNVSSDGYSQLTTDDDSHKVLRWNADSEHFPFVFCVSSSALERS